MSVDGLQASLARMGRGLVGGARRVWIAADGLLRWRRDVRELDDDPHAVIRISRERSDAFHLLECGAALQPDDCLLRLHYWNEHVPSALEGFTPAWALRFGHRVRASLRRLARAVAERPEMADVAGLVGHVAVLSGDAGRTLRFYHALGFDVAVAAPSTPAARLREGLRHLNTWLLVWSVNPAAVRGRSAFGTVSVVVRMSRQRFLALYGEREEERGSDSGRRCPPEGDGSPQN